MISTYIRMLGEQTKKKLQAPLQSWHNLGTCDYLWWQRLRESDCDTQVGLSVFLIVHFSKTIKVKKNKPACWVQLEKRTFYFSKGKNIEKNIHIVSSWYKFSMYYAIINSLISLKVAYQTKSNTTLCNCLNNWHGSWLGGYLLGSLFTKHLEEAVSRSQQVGGVQQELPEEGRADLRLDGRKQSLQLQRQTGEAAADEVELLGRRLRQKEAEKLQDIIFLFHFTNIFIFSSAAAKVYRGMVGLDHSILSAPMRLTSLKSNHLLEETLRDTNH